MIDGVYAIVDVGPARDEAQATEALGGLLRAGIGVVQLRAKTLGARRLLALAREFRAGTRAAGARLVINDRPDVAILAEADAVHLGQDDLPAHEVRPHLPAGMMIGVSCHSIADVERALAEGADHLGYGPVFATRSKTDHAPVVGLEGLAQAVLRAGSTPIVAIGGIEIAQLAEVRRAGARAAAMIGALSRDPERDARAAVEAWGR